MYWREVSLHLYVLVCVFACVTRTGRCVYMSVYTCMYRGTCAHVRYLNAGKGLHICVGEWGVTACGTCWYV